MGTVSSYSFTLNNPINLIDPDGMDVTDLGDRVRYTGKDKDALANELGIGKKKNSSEDIELQFDKNGKYVRSVEDGKNEYSGSVIDEEGTILERFNFNDQNDAKLVEKGKLSLDLRFSKMTKYYLKKSGVDGQKNILYRYPYAFIKSLAHGDMDFVQYLAQYSKTDNVLYIAGNIAYNNYDAGNFLWGLAMKKLGFDYGSVEFGSELNGFFNSKRQNGKGYGVTLGGDSPEDQKAIRKGYFWKTNK